MSALAAAPDYFGAVSTQVAAGGIDSNTGDFLLPGVIDGRVKCMIDTYTALGTETAGKVISMGQKLPAGANVIAILISLSADQASLTLSVGDYANTTRYGSAVSIATTATPVWFPGRGYIVGTTTWTTTYTYDNQIILTTAGTTLTAANIITCIVLYTLD